MENQPSLSRRGFVNTAAAAGFSTLAISKAAHAAGSDVIKFGLVGCGGRGTGAASQIMNSEHPTQLVAMADAFIDKVEGSKDRLAKQYKDKVKVNKDTMFAGFDAYQKVIDSGVDLVVLATPPGFRPFHLEAAVKAGKHVFMEKPVCVDGAGAKKVLDAAAAAKKQNTSIAVGLQRRHQPNYMETIKRLQDGAIGDILYMRAFWNGGGVWTRARQPDQTELEYQMRNWYYFNWLCGDHITEQHIHNLDVINWLKDGFPVRASGMGGREVRGNPANDPQAKEHGEIFDHHFVEYEYADGTRLYSQCRHQRNCMNSVSESAFGSKGYSDINRSIIMSGDNPWKFRGKNVSGHQQEQLDLIDALSKGEIYNEAEYGAMSSMTSVLGRYATYSGKVVTMDQALNTKSTMPANISWSTDAPVKPDENGFYAAAAIPGNYRIA
jgi:myo-inositol 2-dehydrogenase/D-chiro-inositol 1-dehydrogenase